MATPGAAASDTSLLSMVVWPGSSPKDEKRQFNVYLPPALIRRAKHAAVDQGCFLSRFVETALVAYLDRLEEERPR